MIKKVQTFLKSKGHDIGAVDGIWGPRSESAWQQAKRTLPAPWPKLDPKFKAKVRDITTRHRLPDGADEWLLGCMSFESGGTFSPSIRNGAGSGACLTTNVRAVGECGLFTDDIAHVGQLVYALNQETDAIELTSIIGVTRNNSSEILTTAVNGQHFGSTPDHRWVTNNLPLPACSEDILEGHGPYAGAHPLPNHIGKTVITNKDALTLSNNELRLVGALWLFGNVDEELDTATITISYTNNRNIIDNVEDLLCECEIDYKVSVNKSNITIKIFHPFVQQARVLMMPYPHSVRTATYIWDGIESTLCGTNNVMDFYSDSSSLEALLPAIVVPGNVSYKLSVSGQHYWLQRQTANPFLDVYSDDNPRYAPTWCLTTKHGNWLAEINGEYFITGNCGLIQFMPATARGLGTTTDALSKMTAIEQLDYVEAYFKPYFRRINNLGDVYMSILWPAGVGKTDSYVLWDRAKRSTTYRQNAGLDVNRDGVITRGECLVKIREHYFRGWGF